MKQIVTGRDAARPDPADSFDWNDVDAAQYVGLRRDIREQAPPEVLERVAAEQARSRAELAELQRPTHEVDTEATELLAVRLTARFAGADPDTGEKLSDQGKRCKCHSGSRGVIGAAVTPPGTACPEHRENTVPAHQCGRLAIFNLPNGLVQRIRVECKTRGCVKCGDEWGHQNHDAMSELLESRPTGRWVIVEVDAKDSEAWRQKMSRHRRRHDVALDGVSFPVDTSGRRVYVVDLENSCDLGERWKVCHVDDPLGAMDERLREVRSIAAERAKLPAEARPDFGAVLGVGSWKQELSEMKRDQAGDPPDHGWEFLGVVDRDVPVAELIQRAEDLGGLVDDSSNHRRVVVKFRNDVDRDRWLWSQKFIPRDVWIAQRQERAQAVRDRRAARSAKMVDQRHGFVRAA